MSKLQEQDALLLKVDYGKGYNAVDFASWYEDCYWNTWTDYTLFFPREKKERICRVKRDSSTRDLGAFKVNAVTPIRGTADAKLCATEFQASVGQSVLNGGDEKNGWSQEAFPKGPFLIDWTRATSVTQRGSSVFVNTAGGAIKSWVFVLPTDALAARLAYAMEFIRFECDPTASTGF